MSASSRSARRWSPSESSAIASSQVSAPVTHGLVSTQRMPSPGTTNSSQRLSSRSNAAPAADRAAEHRVVPVHRERRLVGEQVAVLAHRVAEPAAGELPLRLRVVEQLGERDAGAQRLVDARGAGQQRERPRSGVQLMPPNGSCCETTQSSAARTDGHSRCTNARSRRTSQWCHSPTARYADMLISPRASSTSPPTIFIGHEPSARCMRRHPVVARARRPRPGRRRAAPSRASTWFQTSMCSPTVHGIAPHGSCIAAIEAARLGDLLGGQDAVDERELVQRVSHGRRSATSGLRR